MSGLGRGRGDFYLGYFAVGLAGGFQFYSFDRIGLGAEKQDPSDFAVNVEVVPASIEILFLHDLCRFPAVRQLLRSKRRGAGLNDFHFLIDRLFRRLTCGLKLRCGRRPIGERDRTRGLELFLERDL